MENKDVCLSVRWFRGNNSHEPELATLGVWLKSFL